MTAARAAPDSSRGAPAAPASPARAAPAGRGPDALLLTVAGIFILFLGVGGAMLWVALRAPPQLVSPSYYDDAAGYDRVLDAERGSLETGWSADLRPAPPGRIVLQVTDAQGRPVPGLAGTLTLYRPSDAALDRVLALREEPAGSGLYGAELAAVQSGHWELTVDLRVPRQKGAGRRLYLTMPWRAP